MSHGPDRCKLPPALWRALESHGISPSAVLRQARLPATLRVEEKAVVTTREFFALWRAVEALTDEPALGITLAEKTPTALNPPPILMAFYARDYRDGLLRVARFKQLCGPERLDFLRADDMESIVPAWLIATEQPPAICIDSAFAALLELGRRGSGRPIAPVRVDLVQPDPKNGRHRKYFGCEVRFGATRDAMHLRSADLDRPFPGHNPELLDLLTPALASSLEEITANSSTSEQVRVVLKRRMASGRPDIADVARELGMSARTLQRRITEDGATYRQLLEEARRELGRDMLARSSFEIDEIAYMLGYQDTSSFYRVFREWEGITPSQWRQTRQESVH
ncbi:MULTISPECIES: AraC family transcriptional regulator [unclassified Mesorhizobium]|uniref:AraC family transcriptional regulator n=1 Tax=unclassified Mesorhizobium TaxID=325217 RepID=UPI00241693BA|nr:MULTISPECIES: AraC family transcriptional regulator [unclassified Mesorhizobium]WFP61047.1 AraC family transcriptional regulator ligand-binding domain-containing protein [Mesorhizobium sp. WSM4904]WFP74276.1 AraC family transcriptional regulator ligand-binding domain-containing protein [Mesorhizobium sp. WSM4906]